MVGQLFLLGPLFNQRRAHKKLAHHFLNIRKVFFIFRVNIFADISRRLYRMHAHLGAKRHRLTSDDKSPHRSNNCMSVAKAIG